MAESFGGDPSLASSKLSIERESVEALLEDAEKLNADELRLQRDRSAQEFQEGQTVSWEAVRQRNGL